MRLEWDSGRKLMLHSLSTNDLRDN